jgi:hypothetical protein
MTQVAVHQFSQEGRKWSHYTDHGKQNTEKCLQGVMAILFAAISLLKQRAICKQTCCEK